MRKIFILLYFLAIPLLYPSISRAEKNEFITVVNPVRVTYYTKDVSESLKSQYKIISQNGINATWLLTMDVINSEKAINVLKGFNRQQELGIWLEISRSSAKDVGIEFHETGSWHHADAVFLAGYVREDRIKFIDFVFDKFKTKFGYYPTSVGSWWTDAYSLDYIKQKYGVTSNLGVSDQFVTDNYQVWGQYWSVPFYPSKNNTAIPASSEKNKTDVINFQWAPRDPVNGYKSSLFSTQDYLLVGQNLDYYENLIYLYGKKNRNEFGQITLGLEGDLPPGYYNSEFSKQMGLVRKLVDKGDFILANMREFSEWYRNKYPLLSPPAVIEAENFIYQKEDEKGLRAIWYQSPKYRIGINYNTQSEDVTVVDLRVYDSEFPDPYYYSPIGEKTLHINIPSVIDTEGNLNNKWTVANTKKFTVSGNNNNLAVTLDKVQIALTPEKFTFTGQVNTPTFELLNNPTLTTTIQGSKYTFIPRDGFFMPTGGVLIKALTSEAVHFLSSRKLRLLIFIILLGIVVIFVKILKNNQLKIYLKVLLIVSLLVFPLAVAQLWRIDNLTEYLINSGEVDALNQLSLLSDGKVIVKDAECLQCEYHTKYRPPSFANQRDYVEKMGRKKIVKNSKIFTSVSREKAYEEVKQSGAKYIYLVKFEKYIEKLPFSPGDLKIDLIYENANAQIWRIN